MALFPEESASCVHTDLFMILSPLKAQSSCTQDHFHPAQARGAEFRSPEPTHKLSSLLCVLVGVAMAMMNTVATSKSGNNDFSVTVIAKPSL